MSLRHERRRRLLNDDADSGDAPPIRLAGGAANETGDAALMYSDAAREARKRPVTSLLPLSRLAIATYISACLSAVGACIGLDLAAAALEPRLGAQAVVALGLEAPASLGRWLASTLLGLAAATGLFIYSLRRHRLDDYHGRYRVWLLAVGACLVLSLMESTALAALARAVVRLGTDWAHVNFDIVWPAMIGILAVAIGVRLAIEMRRCIPALVTLGLAAASFTVAAAVYCRWPMEVVEGTARLWERGSWLVGYVLVLATFLVYSRRVQLDVAGALALPAKPRRKKLVDKAPEKVDEEAAPRKAPLKLRTDLDPVEPAKSDPVRAADAKPAAFSMATSDSPLKQHLSRAERRKLRRAS